MYVNGCNCESSSNACTIMNNSNWDDIRFVLAVAEKGSLNAAAKSLGVTHVTVMRRVAAFEERYGQKVFRKSAGGYSVLPEAEPVLAVARSVEDAVLSVERTIHGTQRELAGSVRIASTDSFCQKLLPNIVTRVSQTYPKLKIVLLSANSYHDMSRLAADLVVRPTNKLEDGLTGVFAGDLSFRLYSTKPISDRWIGMCGNLLRTKAADWMSKNVPKDKIDHESDSFLVLQEMASAGIGMTFLPSFLGDNDPRLERVPSGPTSLAVPVWVASQEEVFDNARFRAVREILVAELGAALLAPQ